MGAIRVDRHLITHCAIFSAAQLADAQPWLDTRDSGLRVDIERLSSAGIIKVPINTRPLMWSGILNDLETADKLDC